MVIEAILFGVTVLEIARGRAALSGSPPILDGGLCDFSCCALTAPGPHFVQVYLKPVVLARILMLEWELKW